KAAVYDTAWGMYKANERVSLKIIGREVEPKELVLTFNGLTGCWQLVGEASEVALTEREAQVMELLEELGEADAQTVAKELEVSRPAARKLLERMREAGKLSVRVKPATKDGGTKKLYSLIEVTEVTKVTGVSGVTEGYSAH
ncbi:MAG: helix-turn-helix domain-containing protein, partial [Desulfofundulus sp.]